jgi:hypothetical protein
MTADPYAEPSSDRYELVAHGANGATYDLGSWRLIPGSSSPAAPHSPRHRSKALQITQPNGPAILTFGVPRLFQTAGR